MATSKKAAAKGATPKRQTKPKAQIDLSELERCAASGLTNEEIAEHLGISERTFYNRKGESADFAAALKNGAAQVARRSQQ